MTARLTTEAVRKLFGGYPSAEEIRERNRQKAQAAIENYNEMLEKVKHAVADLDTAHEALMRTYGLQILFTRFQFLSDSNNYNP